MKISDNSIRIPTDAVVVDRAARQRKNIFDDKGNFVNKDGLLENIAQYGVLSPILIDKDYKLIFGERRYTCSILIGYKDIPARFVEDLSPSEYQVLELIENLSRSELEWRDEVEAIYKLHVINKTENLRWSIEETAKQIGRPSITINRAIRVYPDLNSARIADATSVFQAYNTLVRMDDRANSDALGDLVQATSELFDQPSAPLQDGVSGEIGPQKPGNGASDLGGQGVGNPGGQPAPLAFLSSPPSESILQVSFTKWAPEYTGRPFNLIHCDFPYGVNLFTGAWSGRNTWNSYSDKPDYYITLIRALCENLDKVMAPSGHLMFWTSANIRIQWETIQLFRELAPSLIFNEFPLYWQKTDNVGIVPDPRREARRITETCLVAARDDRLIVRTVSNSYGSPTSKELHPSTKPEPMLRHFMQMFVDENTRMLDPTCGSASSLRAAESLGAAQVLGLEISEEYAKNASVALRNFRNLRKIAK